jgi:GT2 family glycosyltransferase
VTWNTAALTADALRRLTDTDQGCDLRILVYDNASSDATADAIAAAVPQAEITRGETNAGFAAGMNALLSRSDAPWFFALNSDAWPGEGAIGQLVSAALSRPNSAIVAPKLVRPDGSIEHSAHPFPSLPLAFVDALGIRSVVPRRWAVQHCLEGAWRPDVARAVDWAVGAAWLMRRRAVEDVGYFDDRFFMYVEDLEWCWRANTRGWAVWYEPAALVHHVGNVSGSRRFGRSRIAAEQANLRMLLPEILGARSARWYRRLETLAVARQYVAARISGDDDMAGRWRLHLRDAVRHDGGLSDDSVEPSGSGSG